MGGALEQLLVLVIVAAAAVYAVRSIVRSARGSGGDDHCGDCGLKDQHGKADRPPTRGGDHR